MIKIDYTIEQLCNLYNNIPDDLKETFYSEENMDTLKKICENFNLKDKISDIIFYLSFVFLGLLPPLKFKNALKENIEIDEEIVEKIYQRIERKIFYPVRLSLAKLYSFSDLRNINKIESVFSPQQKKPNFNRTDVQKEESEIDKKDPYRESIE